MKSPVRMGLARWLIKSHKAPYALIRGVPENGHAGRAKEGRMIPLYKIVNGEETILAYCETPDECAQAIERDIEEMDDNAEYRWEEIRA